MPQSLISEPMWRDLGSPTLQSSGKVFTAYDEHRMKPLGEFKCRLAHLQSTVNATITVIQSCKRYGLLGRDLFESFFPSVSLSTINTVTAQSCLPPMKVAPVLVDVADVAQLKFSKARPVPLPIADRVKVYLETLERRGIITAASSSRYASPVVWVQKRDKSLRMCVDFKVHVNKAIKSDAYPLPAMETIFAGLCGATDFARLNLKDAYWQIPLDKQSRELCTINTLKGLYHMTHLPKGLKNSSAIFQRVMETILKDLPGVIIYQDDVLIHAPSSDLLAKRLSSIISRLQQKNVIVNQEKSVMLAKEVKFLGHLVFADGIKPDPVSWLSLHFCKPTALLRRPLLQLTLRRLPSQVSSLNAVSQ